MNETRTQDLAAAARLSPEEIAALKAQYLNSAFPFDKATCARLLATLEPGHCLHCDLANATNAWIDSGKVTPTQVLEALANVAAYLIARAAKPGHETEALSSLLEMATLKVMAIQTGHERAGGLHHTTGHA